MIQLTIQKRDIPKFAPSVPETSFIRLKQSPTQRNPERALYALQFEDVTALLDMARKLEPIGSSRGKMFFIGLQRVGEFCDLGTRRLGRDGEMESV